MSHNTFGGMAVLALGMTCGVAFGQEAGVGVSAGAQAGLDMGADANASAEATEPNADAEMDTSESAPPEAVSSETWMHQLVPCDGMVELGLAAGVLFVSRRHNFHIESQPHQKIDPAPELALRGAYYPIGWAGLEAEGAIGTSETEDGTRANPWSLRVSAVGQVPLWRITPFMLFGFGRMGNFSDAMGDDGDPLFHVGAGAKLFLTELVALRLDLRDNLTQRNGSTEGMLTHSVELLVGASITLGGPKPPPATSEPAPAY